MNEPDGKSGSSEKAAAAAKGSSSGKVVSPVVGKPLPLPSACNLVDCSTGRQQFWRFSKGGNQMKLVDVRDTAIDQPVQAKHLARDTSQMWRPHCQNDAWIPAENVYFRVVHLPHCSDKELPGMVELQLEKISPLPLSQAVWTFEIVPIYRPDRNQRTVLVMIAERAVVERYIGDLEKIGYNPDRLEPAVLHQLMATPQGGDMPDGAWIYPSQNKDEEKIVCTVAWWDEGILHNITQIALSSSEHLNELTSHLTATTWAGEMEGWLTGDTNWHLVVNNELGSQWLSVLNDWAGKGIQVEEPPELNTLAGAAAARAARPLSQGNLLPPDRRASYHRNDVDRVWGNILAWSVMFYVVLLSVYFVMKSQVTEDEEAAYQANRKAKKTEKEVKELEVEYRLLQEQRELRGTALNVFRVVSKHIPDAITLDSLNFTESRDAKGNNIVLRGRVSQDDTQPLQDYALALAAETVEKTIKDGQRIQDNLFSEVKPPNTDARAGGYLTWTIVCILKREGVKQ